MRRIAITFIAALLLSGCGRSPEREGALTRDEEQQLNDAAAMLDEPNNSNEAVGQNAVH